MTQLSAFSSTPNKSINESSTNNSLFSNLFHLCFSIFSHPIYFSYFLFFSPYLYRLLSFLSPLFVTTALLLLVALLTFTTPNHSHGSEILESKLDTLLSVVARLLSSNGDGDRDDEEAGCLDELEAYLVTFQESIFEDAGSGGGSEEEAPPYSEFPSGSVAETAGIVAAEDVLVEKNVIMEETKVIAEVKSLESLFEEKEEDEEVKSVGSPKVEENESKLPLRNGSKVRDQSGKKASEFGLGMKAKSRRLLDANLGSPETNLGYNGNHTNQSISSSNLGSFGSMRAEKEWRRTLACKLFEERHNAGGSDDGMDMLWETHEAESSASDTGRKSGATKGKKAEPAENGGDEEEEEEEEEDEMEGKLCCLQALKFSAGKMNLGMGRPNLVKFSKALKGIGWLHNAGRHGRKGNSNK